MNAGESFFGGLAAAIVTVGAIAAADFSAGAFAVFMAMAIVGYIVARLTADTKAADVVRGVLIGLNTGLNLTLWIVIGGKLFGDQNTGGLVGAVAGVLTFLSVIPTLSQSDVYQGFIGWCNWLLPMSWVVVGVGFLFYGSSALGHLIFYKGLKWTFFQALDFKTDWKTGTWFMKGGYVSNLNPLHTAFNMGAFSFVDKTSGQMHMEHEAGHTLNLATFGWVFHFVGALDENVAGGGASAYSERLAESNVPGTSQSDIIHMWAA
jgi:hypothetical protein